MMLKQRINCQMCIKTTSARQNRKISFVKPTIYKYFLGIQEPCAIWQKTTTRAKPCLEELGRKLLAMLCLCASEGKPISYSVCSGCKEEEWSQSGQMVTQLQPWLAPALPPHICLYPLARQFILVTICEEDIITPLACMSI